MIFLILKKCLGVLSQVLLVVLSTNKLVLSHFLSVVSKKACIVISVTSVWRTPSWSHLMLTWRTTSCECGCILVFRLNMIISLGYPNSWELVSSAISSGKVHPLNIIDMVSLVSPRWFLKLVRCVKLTIPKFLGLAPAMSSVLRLPLYPVPFYSSPSPIQLSLRTTHLSLLFNAWNSF